MPSFKELENEAVETISASGGMHAFAAALFGDDLKEFEESMVARARRAQQEGGMPEELTVALLHGVQIGDLKAIRDNNPLLLALRRIRELGSQAEGKESQAAFAQMGTMTNNIVKDLLDDYERTVTPEVEGKIG